MSIAKQGMTDKVTIKLVEAEDSLLQKSDAKIEGSLPQKGESPCDWHILSNKDGVLKAEHYRGRTYKGPAQLFMDAFK